MYVDIFILAALELEQARHRSSQNTHTDGGALHQIIPEDVNLVMYNKYTDPTNTATTVIGRQNHTFNVVGFLLILREFSRILCNSDMFGHTFVFLLTCHSRTSTRFSVTFHVKVKYTCIRVFPKLPPIQG